MRTCSLFIILACATATLQAQDTTPPSIERLIPAAGSTVTSLSGIEVLFDEPVLGVDMTDLLINGVPATGVEFGIPGQVVFEFPTAPAGLVTISFAPGHGISDLAEPPNLFTGASWTYNVDPSFATTSFVISEFMASNDKTLNDDDGEQSDWIEIYNPANVSRNLEGWFLTDNAGDLTQWRFPNRSIPANSYLVVFASNKNRTNQTGNLHTSFQLNTAGEYLALVDPNTNIVSSFAPVYPQQLTDVSYGRERNDPNILGFYVTPTPGAPNSTSGSGFAPTVEFSHNSRTFPTYAPFQLNLSTPLPDAQIYYSFGTNLPSPTSPQSLRYTNAITVDNTLAITARAFANGLLPSAPVSRIYIALTTETNVLNFNSDLPIMILHNYGQGTVPANSDAQYYVFVQTFESDFERSSMTNPPTLSVRGMFHARGSSTLTSSAGKAAFFLETRDEFGDNLNVPLLGLPSESDWVLYAPNNFEPALMHNPLAMQLARDGGEYAPRTRFVEVFLKDNSGTPDAISSTGFSPGNGDYQGIYVLMEKIKRDKNRVDIEKLEPEHTTEPEVTGGYLLSIDRTDSGTSPLSAGGASLNWLEPNYRTIIDSNRAPQRAYLTSYLNAFNTGLNGADLTNAFVNGVNNTNHYSNYINVNSWIRRHVHEVLTFNVDALRLSGYLYKDRNKKIEYGPAWDYDRTQGSRDGRDINPRVWANGTDFFNFTPWWGRLFRAPDFFQLWIDRYQQERRPGGSMTTNNIYGRIDEFYDQLKEAQPREQERWNIPLRGPNGIGTGTYLTELEWKRNWYASRLNFMDTNFLAPPVFSTLGGLVASNFSLTLNPAFEAGSSILYTLDGTDPRLPNGYISPVALSNNGPVTITITSNVRIFARSWNPNHSNQTGGNRPAISSEWSGPTEEGYYISIPPLRITELMFHPQSPAAGSPYSADDFEYIEFTNIGDQPLNVNHFRLRSGVDFDFPDAMLAPGERAVIVKNIAAFEARYGNARRVLGSYPNDNLANDGDHLVLQGLAHETILDFSYEDDWYPATDGAGFSLQIVNETAATDTWSLGTSWRPSGIIQGTPAAADPGAANIATVYINEALINTEPVPGDAVELYNSTGNPVNIGGWFLTDNFNSPKKYRIPDGTTIPADGYLVFYQSTSFGVGSNGFAFSSKGEEIFVFSADTAGTLTGWVHGYKFGPQAKSVTFGRHLLSTGEDHFVAQVTPSLGNVNPGPLVGPVVISEINYHPPDFLGIREPIDNTQEEYIELHNITGAPAPLYDPSNPANTWRLRDAVSYTFPVGTVIPPGGYALVVSFDPSDINLRDTFRIANNVPPSTPLFGPWNGKLDNSQDSIELTRPDVPDLTSADPVSEILVDKVNYKDTAPWPVGLPDGLGAVLGRVNDSAYGNDPANWRTAPKTPGEPLPTGDIQPAIVTQPANTSGIEGQSASFTVGATGSALGYIWTFNGTVLPGASAATLTLNNLRATQSGNYAVFVFNSAGSLQSSSASLLVRTIPRIVQNPLGIEVYIKPDSRAANLPNGTNVTFTIAATSTEPPISYQWRFNGVDIPGATGSSYTVLDVQLEDEGDYSVAITDGTGTISSLSARLVPWLQPVIVLPPVNQTVTAGGQLSMSVGVTGNPLPMAYSWRRNLGSLVIATNSGDFRTNLVTLNVDDASLSLVEGMPSTNFGMRIVIYNDANNRPGITTIFNITVLADTDRDGIADILESALGLDPNNAADAAGDLDNDGISNGDEAIAGTDATNALSFLKIEQSVTPGVATLQFGSVSNHTYSIQYTDNINNTVWEKLADFPALTTDFVHQIPDPNWTTNRFYRVATPYQP